MIALALRLPEDESLTARIQQRLSGELQFDEYRLFLEIMLKASQAWNGLCKGGALLVFREVVGATVTDDELCASLEAYLPLEDDM